MNRRTGVFAQVGFGTVALAAGAPLALAVLEMFHPHVHDLMDVDLRVWLTIHYAQIPLFMLSALAMAALIRGYTGLAPAICRVAMFVFAASYIPFDTAAGVATGVLVRAARASGDPAAWRPAVEAIWAHPIVGGSGAISPPPLLAVLGTVAWAIGGVAAAIALKRHGHSWAPCLVLVVSAFGLTIFKTHAAPGGPFTFGGLALAAAWLLWERRSRSPARDIAFPSREGGVGG
jgi:hypothetical protein